MKSGSAMKVIELFSVKEEQVKEFQDLYAELSPGINVTLEMVARAVESQGTHLFALIDYDGKIIGSATLCVSDLPTGRKASVEAVVVKTTYRGQGLGKKLMTHLIDYARKNLDYVNISLTSHPKREAANALYRLHGFKQRETNVYELEVKG